VGSDQTGIRFPFRISVLFVVRPVDGSMQVGLLKHELGDLRFSSSFRVERLVVLFSLFLGRRVGWDNGLSTEVY